MFKLFIIFIFCFLSVTATAIDLEIAKAGATSANERIIGGALVTTWAFPFSAIVLYAPNGVGFRQTCGGTILNSRSILSAIICWHSDNYVDKFNVRVGSVMATSTGVVHKVNKIISHPNYNTWNRNNNIGILRLADSITLAQNIRPARLAGSGFKLQDDVDWLGVEVVAIGWGRSSTAATHSEQLRSVNIATVTPARCREIYGVNFITPNMICAGWAAGGRGSCDGDLGSPIISNNTVVGITSFIIGCGDGAFPPVYTRLSQYTDWILKTA